MHRFVYTNGSRLVDQDETNRNDQDNNDAMVRVQLYCDQ